MMTKINAGPRYRATYSIDRVKYQRYFYTAERAARFLHYGELDGKLSAGEIYDLDGSVMVDVGNSRDYSDLLKLTKAKG